MFFLSHAKLAHRVYVLVFLGLLERERSNCVRTRNARLAGLRSFRRYRMFSKLKTVLRPASETFSPTNTSGDESLISI